jgi:Mrp family chromosome partitioning ATPase
MKQLISRLESTFDAVIIDAPPLLPVTDAAVLAQQVGGVAVVVGTQKVRTTDLEKSLAALEMVKADVLGIVLNRLPIKGPDAYAYSYYSYGNALSQTQTTQSLHSDPPEALTNADESFSEEILRGASRDATRLSNGLGRSRSDR